MCVDSGPEEHQLGDELGPALEEGLPVLGVHLQEEVLVGTCMYLQVLHCTVLCCTVLYCVTIQGSCTDNRGQLIQEGRLFEPGPDECQVSTCVLVTRGPV